MLAFRLVRGVESAPRFVNNLLCFYSVCDAAYNLKLGLAACNHLAMLSFRLSRGLESSLWFLTWTTIRYSSISDGEEVCKGIAVDVV